MKGDKLVRHMDSCMGCGICAVVCPVNTKLTGNPDFDLEAGYDQFAIRISCGIAQPNPDACITCGLCTRNCPVGALTLVKEQAK